MDRLTDAYTMLKVLRRDLINNPKQFSEDVARRIRSLVETVDLLDIELDPLEENNVVDIYNKRFPQSANHDNIWTLTEEIKNLHGEIVTKRWFKKSLQEERWTSEE